MIRKTILAVATVAAVTADPRPGCRQGQVTAGASTAAPCCSRLRWSTAAGSTSRRSTGS